MSLNVEGEQVVDLGRVDVDERGIAAYTCVADQMANVPGTQAFRHRGNTLAGGQVGGKDLNGGTGLTEFVGQLLQPVRAAGHQDEVQVVCKKAGVRGTDTGGSTRYQSKGPSHDDMVIQ
ncbi:hypothetical protein GCM10010306_101860 [Streptomyces umbrinus]|nr:hypothetical protein GCM10010306_101860 [Streptomyces umbrinus]